MERVGGLKRGAVCASRRLLDMTEHQISRYSVDRFGAQATIVARHCGRRSQILVIYLHCYQSSRSQRVEGTKNCEVGWIFERVLFASKIFGL